jgi:hypothetical protein
MFGIWEGLPVPAKAVRRGPGEQRDGSTGFVPHRPGPAAPRE